VSDTDADGAQDGMAQARPLDASEKTSFDRAGMVAAAGTPAMKIMEKSALSEPKSPIERDLLITA